MAYCEVCNSRAADSDVAEYLEGKSHVRPEITDSALSYAVLLRRRELYQQLKREQPAVAVTFPEFDESRERMKFCRKLGQRSLGRYHTLVKEVPGFRSFSDARPFNQDSGQSRRKRKHTRKTWTKQTIAQFAETCDISVLAKMLDILGQELPWWIACQLEDASVELPMAA